MNKSVQLETARDAYSKVEFTKLIEPLFDEIYAYSIRMTRNKQSAEDLTADTFARAWRYFRHFKTGTNFRAWIYSILTTTFINQYRKKRKQPGIVDYDQYQKMDEFYVYNKLSKQSSRPMEDPAKIIGNKFKLQDVRNALDKLPEDFRQIVMLSDIKGFSYRDIASILKLPMGTVRSRLSRGRRFLQKHLWYYSEKGRG